MSWDSLLPSAVRGRLARHVGRLQQHLDEVGEQVREAVATAVGRTVAEAVGEAVYDALLSHDSSSRSFSRSATGYYGRSSPSRREWEDSVWQGAHDPWRDPYDEDDDFDDPRYRDDEEPDAVTSTDHRSPTQRWHRAVAAGAQAAAWWLRRHAGQASLLAALTIGALAGLAVLAGQASGIASLVLSALGLAYLLDLLRSASTLLRRNATS